MIIGVICLTVAVAAFIISILQFKGKGYLFNNAYIFASDEERRNMDKKPYYKQTGIVFLFIGIIFLLNAIQVLLRLSWIFWVIVIVGVIAVVYAIISSAIISPKSNEKMKK